MRFRFLLATMFVAATAPARGQANIAFTAAPGSLSINNAVAGADLQGKTDNAARYSVTVASGRMKIVGQLNSPLPSGVTLTVSLAGPAGSTSLGTVVLTTAAQDLVRYIPVGQYTGLTITYTLSASVSAGVIPFNANNLVLTLADDP